AKATTVLPISVARCSVDSGPVSATPNSTRHSATMPKYAARLGSVITAVISTFVRWLVGGLVFIIDERWQVIGKSIRSRNLHVIHHAILGIGRVMAHQR